MYIVVASSTKIDCKTRNMLQVLMAGGVPSYLVHDMTTTPRTSGTLILTTHALYWRPNVMRQIFSRSSEKSAKGKLKRFELRHTTTTSTVDEAQAQSEWQIEAIRSGPFGLGVTDTAMRIRCCRRNIDGRTVETELRFNFPMNTELRDTFVASVTEVVGPHPCTHLHLTRASLYHLIMHLRPLWLR
jgi:hypothetical protein